jgi:hypothetical protein
LIVRNSGIAARVGAVREPGVSKDGVQELQPGTRGWLKAGDRWADRDHISPAICDVRSNQVNEGRWKSIRKAGGKRRNHHNPIGPPGRVDSR